MPQYRIKEHDYGNQKNYEIQRKSILGFWYNPDNIDGNTTGFFDNIEDAEECIKQKLTPTKIAIIRIFKGWRPSSDFFRVR